MGILAREGPAAEKLRKQMRLDFYVLLRPFPQATRQKSHGNSLSIRQAATKHSAAEYLSDHCVSSSLYLVCGWYSSFNTQLIEC